MLTIRDVAAHAGVAVGTVSRVLHHHPAVQEEICRRVWQAVEELGYHPLRRRSGHQVVRHVGIVTLGMDQSLVSLPVIGHLLHGVHDALRAQEITLSLIDIPDPACIPQVLTTHGVDAVIIKAALRSGDLCWPVPIQTALTSLPHVWLTGRLPGFTGDVCGPDDYQIGALAASHLLVHGHRALAIVNPDPGHLLFARRCAAFQQTAQHAGASVRFFESHTVCPSFPCPPVANLLDVLPLIDQVLVHRPRPTAIFVPADSIATQVYRALAIRGVAIGMEISVLSVNNERPLLAGLHPRLTTIEIHAEAIGRRTAELLLWRIEHPNAVENIVQLSPTLVPGESVASLIER
ncbi:MAG: LacI family DNA-binding transcriptional regulator [Armatimonadota bacterium]